MVKNLSSLVAAISQACRNSVQALIMPTVETKQALYFERRSLIVYCFPWFPNGMTSLSDLTVKRKPTIRYTEAVPIINEIVKLSQGTPTAGMHAVNASFERSTVGFRRQ